MSYEFIHNQRRKQMLKIELNNETGIAVFEPEGNLSKDDFDAASNVVDQYLASHEKLNGIIINTEAFPGWESFGAMVKHLQFVKDHHKQLSHIALVTDSKLGDVSEKMVGHFISADVKHFPYNQLSDAEEWILSDS
jgi:hypothetical protein